MKVCIVGGGNIGSILLTDFSKFEKSEVRLLTGDSSRHSGSMKKINAEKDVISERKNILVFENPHEAYENVDKVFFTLPKNVLFTNKTKYIDALPNNVDVYFVPGSGGVELFANTFLEKNIQVVGFQRVHSIARVENYGRSVCELDRKEETSIAFFPNNIDLETKEKQKTFLENLLKMPIKILENYLTVSLVPSNSILHTSRIYDLFYEHKKNDVFENNIYFYRSWTDRSSKILFQADEELQTLCRTIDQDALKSVVSLKNHYESPTIESMTNKIKSIESFKNIHAPLIEYAQNSFRIDEKSRYFIEDFEYGLMFIYLLSQFLDTPNETIENLLIWYSDFMKKSYNDFAIVPLFKEVFQKQKQQPETIMDFYELGYLK